MMRNTLPPLASNDLLGGWFISRLVMRWPSQGCAGDSGFNPCPIPRLPDDDQGANSFDRREEQVLRKSGRPAPSDQRRNEGKETVDKGDNASGDDIRQPVRPERKQSTRQNHGDGYFHQDR